MDFDLTFKGIRKLLKKLTGILVPLVFVSLLLGIIFGPDTPFIGDVYNNVAEIIKMLGEDGLLALISVIIILAYLKK
jgi:hypothetical protein|tara:strand:- start:102 stop:332 length:231 start_codon:yes stop_codon:yes gene_type:complete